MSRTRVIERCNRQKMHRSFVGDPSRSEGPHFLWMTAYSQGARTMLEAIRSLNRAFKLKTLTVMAAAIDDTCLVKEYQDAAKQMGKISVMASSCDDVLKWAFPAGNLASGMVTRGDPYWHGALGRYGPNPANQPANLWQTPNLPELWTFGPPSYINSEGSCRASTLPCSFDGAASGNVPTLYRSELAAGLGRWLCFHEV